MLKNNLLTAFAGMVVMTAPAIAAEENMELAIGQRESITLPGNPTTGYIWQVAESAECVEVEVKLETAENPRGMVGCPRATVVTVSAIKAGQGTVKLVYARPWEKGKAPAETHLINVTVK